MPPPGGQDSTRTTDQDVDELRLCLLLLETLEHPLPYFNREQSISLVGRNAIPEARDLVAWTVHHLSAKTLGADLKVYTEMDIRDRMVDVRCPVLIVRGEDDWLVTQPMVEATAGRLVNARPLSVVTLPGIGHYAPMEAPEAVAEAIRTFVTRLPR